MVDKRADQSPPTAPLTALPGMSSRGHLIYQLLKFQMKLFLDGTSDLIFSVLAFGAVIAGLIRGGPDADRPLHDVMALGRRTEHWINLYGANDSGWSADAAMAPLEKKLVARLEREGVIGRTSTGAKTSGADIDYTSSGNATSGNATSGPPPAAPPDPPPRS